MFKATYFKYFTALLAGAADDRPEANRRGGTAIKRVEIVIP